MTPEQKARQLIDLRLAQAGWAVQDYADINPGAARGVAVREFPLKTGDTDYLLYADGKVIGVVEAKREGQTLTGVEPQSAKYTTGLIATLPHHRRPLPFSYESTGEATRFTDHLDPDPRSREVFTFHRPGELLRLVGLAARTRPVAHPVLGPRPLGLRRRLRGRRPGRRPVGRRSPAPAVSQTAPPPGGPAVFGVVIADSTSTTTDTTNTGATERLLGVHVSSTVAVVYIAEKVVPEIGHGVCMQVQRVRGNSAGLPGRSWTTAPIPQPRPRGRSSRPSPPGRSGRVIADYRCAGRVARRVGGHRDAVHRPRRPHDRHGAGVAAGACRARGHRRDPELALRLRRATPGRPPTARTQAPTR